MTNNKKELYKNAQIVETDEISVTEPSKGINLYIDPTGNKTTPVAFKLSDKEISLQTIRDKGAEYEKLVIDGFLDKAGYEKVKKAKNEFLKTRTTLQKVAKSEVIDPINSWLKTYKEGLEEVSDECQVWQDKMQTKLTAIDEAFQIEQQRKENEAKELRDSRVAAIEAVGGVYNSQTTLFTFPHDSGLLTNDTWMSEWDNERFNKFITEATESWDTEQERVRKEKEANDTALALANDILDERVKTRTRELTRMYKGVPDGDNILVCGTVITIDALKTFTPIEWEELIEKFDNYVEPKGDVPTIKHVNPLTPEESVAITNERMKGNGFSSFTIVNTKDIPHLLEQEDEDSRYIVGEDMICPVNKVECDDECCTVGSICNASGSEGLFGDPVDPDTEAVGDDKLYTISFEESKKITESAFSTFGLGGVYITAYFKNEQPFIEHPFSKSVVRFYHPHYEEQASADVTPIDKGYIEGLGLHYLVIKKK